jgi:hypothetical protein
MARNAKSQAKEPKEQVTNLLTKVPAEHAFLCHDGKVFTDMKELAEGLVAMSDENFGYHAKMTMGHCGRVRRS